MTGGFAILRDLYKTGGRHVSETTVPIRDGSLEVLTIGPGDLAACRAPQKPSKQGL